MLISGLVDGISSLSALEISELVKQLLINLVWRSNMKPFGKKFINKEADIPERPRFYYDKEPYDKAEERGQKEVSKYDEEYIFLVRLIKTIAQVAPEAGQEMKDLSNAYPFVTIDDVGDLAAKIWTLATTKYKIPAAWLTQQLEKKGSLKIADLWPAQEQAQDMLSHEHNSLSYNNDQEADTSVSGPRPDDVGKTSKSKKLNINNIVKILNAKEPKVVNINTAEHTLTLVDGTTISFDDAAKQVMEMDKESVFSGAEFSTTEFNTTPTLDNGPFSSPEDQGAGDQKQPFPNTSWVPADDKNEDEEPYSDIASSLTRPFSKKANPNSRYWIAPDGTEFNAGTHHGAWIKNNKETLKQYGVPFTSLGTTWTDMIKNGWVRVSNEPAGSGFQIQVQDLNNISSFLDDFVAKNYQQGDKIELGDQNGNLITIDDPFPNLQKALRKSKKMSKQAAVDSQFVNQMLQSIHEGGGVTYNLFNGNLSGTPNYSVSIYPDRERIVEGVDFDILEGYVEDNEDLLSDAKNSLGVWSNNGKVYLDVVVIVPDKNEAIELARQHNQIAIWDLQNNQEIPTGGTGGSIARAFSKLEMSILKTADHEILTQDDQNEIAASSSPAYVIAMDNYIESVKHGHEPTRSLQYAIESVANVEKIDEKKLIEFINNYL